jgi:dihydroxy-acid dehydratase
MNAPTKKLTIDQLRSQRWMAPDYMRAFTHRARMAQVGYRREEFMNRPVIGIINTWSDISTCHAHLKDRAQSVREGVIRAGGFPIELPALSLGEVWVKPTTMLYRNMLAMETEELIRSHPIDGVVILGGCDKTTPGTLMGAFSVNLPTLFVPAGASSNAYFMGQRVGTGTGTVKWLNEKKAGRLSEEKWLELERTMTRTNGTCNTMGTASTMTAVAEVLGFTLPGGQSIPATDSAHPKLASLSGERIVDMVWEDLRPRDIVSEASFHNAAKIVLAIGGSTNACVHLPAMAGRVGVKFPLSIWEQYNRDIPVIANVTPAGSFLMEDFYFAGGLRALLKQLGDKIDTRTRTCTGKTLAHDIADAEVYNDDVIRSLTNPVTKAEGIAVLKGNLSPNGCVIKPSAAAPHLMKHTGRALVFDNHADLNAAMDDMNLDVDESCVLVLRNAGPKGAPGMPEWGNIPLPKKLLQKGVRDMVRISDARMSGTHFGTCILHVCPESAVGGPLALIQTGDMIALDVAARSINVLISDEEMAARKAKWVAPKQRYARGWAKLYVEHVTQADVGADLDFLEGDALLEEPEIF